LGKNKPELTKPKPKSTLKKSESKLLQDFIDETKNE